MKNFSYSLGPDQLWQSINPWKFYLHGAQLGFVNINLGRTPAPEVEEQILDEVGSYGRQIGRIGDALGVLLQHLSLNDLTEHEKDTLAILKGQLAEVRKIKARSLRHEPASG